jgi:hypothetical protein
VYVVEHDAIAAGVAGTDEHRRMRQARTGRWRRLSTPSSVVTRM